MAKQHPKSRQLNRGWRDLLFACLFYVADYLLNNYRISFKNIPFNINYDLGIGELSNSWLRFSGVLGMLDLFLCLVFVILLFRGLWRLFFKGFLHYVFKS